MTTPANRKMSTGWAVTGQTMGMQVGPDGNITDGVTVYFRTGAGVDGKVFVPNAIYTPGEVQKMIHARAMQLDEVQSLSAPATGS